jgi:hypothetical protein
MKSSRCREEILFNSASFSLVSVHTNFWTQTELASVERAWLEAFCTTLFGAPVFVQPPYEKPTMIS